MNHDSAYGLWSLVIINAAVLIIFASGFAQPQSQRDWRSFGAFSVLIVALFVEMYGFPLRIYLISGWLLRWHPNPDLFSHDAGHLWNTLPGWEINPHFDPLHILSNVLPLVMFPILLTMYVRGAQREESEVLAEFGDRYRRYANSTPAFVPHFGRWQRMNEA